MGIVGNSPESGLRIDLERPHGEGPPWRYEGHAVTPDARFALVATVSAEGAVTVTLPPDAPPGLADRTARMMRAVWKHSQEDGAAPPRRVVRWRAEL